MRFIAAPRAGGRRAAALAAALLGLAAIAARPAAAATTTLTPVADSYVDSAQPSTNFGGSTQVRADGSPVVRAYLRFDARTISGSVTRATLRVWANSTHSSGYQVRAVADTAWGERTITYENAPAVSSSTAASSGGFAAGAWTQATVTPLVTGPGLYSMALVTSSSTAMSLASRESGAHAPQLVIETGSSGGGTDTTAPSAPGNVAARADSASQVTVSWSAATDNVGVTGYRVLRDGAQAGQVAGSVLSFTDTGLRASTTYRYSVVALDAAGNASAASAASAAASVTTPAATGGSDPVIAAAGDIACDPANPAFNGGAGTSGNCRERSTSDIVLAGGYSAVLPLGDNQNFCGSLAAYRASYALSWGRLLSLSHPVPGNHDYITSPQAGTPSTGCDASNAGARGYFSYFGARAGEAGKGYYSYDLGAWHLIALNTNCGDVGGCSASSPQGRWLAADLAAHKTLCTLAYFHIPLFSSGGRAASNSRPLWDQLYAAGAEVVLDGHDHIYERFAPQTPTGAADSARGIREFIVGTGGQNHTSIASVAANSQIRNASTYGVLRLTLHPTSYDWKFLPEKGASFTDSGSQACH